MFMKKLSGVILVLVGCLLTTAPALGSAFNDCVSASNFAANTAHWYVGLTFGRVACDTNMLPLAQEGLNALLSKSALTTSDNTANKMCYFQSYFLNVMNTLQEEYTRCNVLGAEGFNCVDAGFAAELSGSLFVALYRALGTDLTHGLLNSVFFSPESFVCPSLSQDNCITHINKAVTLGLGSELPEEAAPLVEVLNTIVCR
jgi:hypothetical protein